MKLRIAGNELRLRLSAEEVDALGRGEAVQAAIALGGTSLRYGIRPSESTGTHFDGRAIMVDLERDACSQWALDPRTSLTASDGEVSVLIEKDLPCRKHARSAVD